jgi:acyl dehydratase
VSTAATALGATGPARTYGPITRTDIVRYAGASGDFNPNHHDEEFARGAGFPSVFSMGMLQAGILATYATDWLGAERIRRFTVRFLDQVWPGDELACEGVVTRRVVDGDDELLTVDLTCRRQTGAVAISGSAEFSFTMTAPDDCDKI